MEGRQMRSLLVTLALVLAAASVAAGPVLPHRRAAFRDRAAVDPYSDYAAEFAGYWAMEAEDGDPQADYEGEIWWTDLGATAPTKETGKRGSGAGLVTDAGYDFAAAAANNPANGVILSVWVYVVDSGSAANVLYLCKVASTVYYFRLANAAGGDDGNFYVKAEITQSNSTIKSITSGEVYSESTWYHLMLVAADVAGTYALRLYVNGGQVGADVPYDGTLFDSAAIGGVTWTNASVVIDEVALWTDLSFATAEEREAFVSALYNAGSGYFPGDDNTVLLLHGGDGLSDASTYDWDYSFPPHTVTFVGDAQTDTAQKKFGSASYLFDGTGDYLEIPNSADFNLGTAGNGDFTIDWWFRTAAVSAPCYVSCHDTGGTGHNGWTVGYGYYGGAGRLYSWCGDAPYMDFAWTPTVNTWYHLAFVRNGTEIKAYVDGEYKVTLATGDFSSDGSPLYIGQIGEGAGFANGHIDEIRISKGIARWTSNFTPPTSRY
jgi:hypothetical protein